MDDLISRQAAIDTLATGEELLRRVLDDMDVVGNEREKYEWGLGLIESDIADMKDLPSAQPYTDEEIQTMQDLEQAQIEKAYEIGLREGRKKGKWIEPKPKGWLSYNIKAYAECSECGNVQFLGSRMNYCPSCGSYNGGGDDEAKIIGRDDNVLQSRNRQNGH